MPTTQLACDGCGRPRGGTGAGDRPAYCPNCAQTLGPLNEPTVEARATPDRKTEPVFANPRTPSSVPVPSPLPPLPALPARPPAVEPDHPPTEPMLSLGCGSVWHLPVLVGVSLYAAVATALAVWGWLRAM